MAVTGLTFPNVSAGGLSEPVDEVASDATGTVQATTATVSAPEETATAVVSLGGKAQQTNAVVTSSVEQTIAATADTADTAERTAAPVEAAAEGTTAALAASVADGSAASPGVLPASADSIVEIVEETAGAAAGTVGETPTSLTTTVTDVSATPVEAASELAGTTTPAVIASVDTIASAVAPEALAPVLVSTDAVGGTVSGVLALGEDTVGLLPATGSVTTAVLGTAEPAIPAPAVAVRAEQQVTVRTETIGAGLGGPPAASEAATTTVLRDRPPASGGASDFSGMAQAPTGEVSQHASAKPAPAGERRVPERYAFGSAPSFVGSSGSFPILLATLAAGLFLVAPGLSRRLRLGLAPWPRPILQLSLERPG